MKLVLGILSLVGSVAFADGNKLVFTSFVMDSPNSNVAEICGKIEGSSDQSTYNVKLVVDPQSKGPAIYNVVVGPEKKFCTLVLSHTRRVNGEVR